jgi:hypothetical protein
MRNIAIARDLVRGIDDHHTFIRFISQDTSYFTQQCGLTHTWATKNQDGLTLIDNIADQGNTTQDRSADTAGQTDNFPFAVAEGADAM